MRLRDWMAACVQVWSKTKLGTMIRDPQAKVASKKTKLMDLPLAA